MIQCEVLLEKMNKYQQQQQKLHPLCNFRVKKSINYYDYDYIQQHKQQNKK